MQPANVESRIPNGKGIAPAEVLHRAVRVGIEINGRLVAERMHHRRAPISVGPSARDGFVVPLARSWVLLEPDGDSWALCFAEGMDGRVAASSGSPPEALTSLRERATRHGETYRVPLPSMARGKVRIGEITVLFQLLTVPASPPRPRLPPSLRGSLWHNLDWVMIGAVVCSLSAQSGFVAYLSTVDWPRRPDAEDVPAPFIPAVVMRTLPSPEPALTDHAPSTAPPSRTARPPTATPRRPARPARPAILLSDADRAANAAAERAALAERVGKLGAMMALGARGPGGLMNDLLRHGGAPGDAERQLAEAGGVTLAGGGAGLVARGGGGTGEAQGIGRLRGPTVGHVEGGLMGPGGEAMALVRGRLGKAPPPTIEGPDGDVDPEWIADQMKTRRGAVLACYERALRHSPGLRGRLTLAFTITTTGAVIDVEIDDEQLGDPGVGECVTAIARRWRFPPAKGKALRVSVPFILQAAA